MNLLRDAPLWAQLLLALLLAAAAVQDVVQRRISNLLCLAVGVLAAVAAWAAGPDVALWQNGASFAVLLLAGLPLFAAGWLGGGDVKLLAMTGLWVDLAALAPLIVLILLIGGVGAVIALALRRRRPARPRRGLPYGVAIALGVAVFLAQPGLLPDAAPVRPLDLHDARVMGARP